MILLPSFLIFPLYSILMACKAYRNYARATRGVTRPEMFEPLSFSFFFIFFFFSVLPRTAHVAFDKAAEYFCIKLVKVDLDGELKGDLNKMKSAITRNTILLVGSAPNYPHGVIDDIVGITKIAAEHDLPVHVDACLGGFFLPWVRQLEGYELPPFDFSIPGVTSISCDTHKYGYAAKGTSVLLFSKKDIRHHMYFVATEWPGGIYATSTMPGSRVGAVIAACWAALVYTGKKGYRDTAAQIMETQSRLKRGLNEMKGVKMVGDSHTSVIAWTTTEVNVYSVADYMSKRGWHLNVLQKPKAVHICLTARHVGKENKILEDWEWAMEQAKRNPTMEGGKAPMYGMMATLPDRSLLTEMAWAFIDGNLDA